ncbi:subtilase-type proteinase Rrt12p [[Candida] anglica]
MLKKLLSLYILVTIQVAAAEDLRYLVSLKVQETYESFIRYDKTYPLSQHINPLIDHAYSIGKYSGFSGNFTEQALERLQRCPLVAEITPDITVEAFETTIQNSSPRHLARLSQEDNLESETFSYCFNNDTQSPVLAYVIDSGININHPEFGGRAQRGADFTGEGSGDYNGHGTHVAGLIGSNTYGVSKNVRLVEVKALNKYGAGSLSTIISAIEFAVNHRSEAGLPGVANLSLGAMRSGALNRAVTAALETGLVVVVAAGNSNSNACMTSPASSRGAITVGSIDDCDDSLTPFTNWGECVDLFASGLNVQSVHYDSESDFQTLSGTSMSSPIVAGQVSVLLSEGVPPGNILKTLKDMSTKNKIPKSSIVFRFRSPNRIVYNGMEGECDNL